MGLFEVLLISTKTISTSMRVEIADAGSKCERIAYALHLREMIGCCLGVTLHGRHARKHLRKICIPSRLDRILGAW